MKVLILEDEHLAAQHLATLVNQMEPSFEIVKSIDTVREAVDWLSANSPDLIFADIHLADGLSFQIFEKKTVNLPVIFTTAYDQYAIKAFKVNSVDYLLKPINEEDLKQSIIKFKKITQNMSFPGFDVKKLLEQYNKKIDYQERFIVYAGPKIKTIKTCDVSYFYLTEKSTFLCTFENRSYDIDYTLDSLETLLDPKIFFRVNRQYILNIEAIETMHTLSKSRLKIDIKPGGNHDIVVATNRVKDFKEWLNK